MIKHQLCKRSQGLQDPKHNAGLTEMVKVNMCKTQSPSRKTHFHQTEPTVNISCIMVLICEASFGFSGEGNKMLTACKHRTQRAALCVIHTPLPGKSTVRGHM